MTDYHDYISIFLGLKCILPPLPKGEKPAQRANRVSVTLAKALPFQINGS